ncbi:MAG: DUF3592 domain-containing protein [Desulfuromonadales bacterium]|nr:DUF3592 domain-containing protein [Desulfuromonadales bacterium]
MFGMFGKKAQSDQPYPLVMGMLKSVSPGTGSGHFLFVQFTTLDGQQITASEFATIGIARMGMAQFHPGLRLPVRYNPAKPKEMKIEWYKDPNRIRINLPFGSSISYSKPNSDGISVGDQILVTEQITQQALDIMDNPNHVETKGVILESKPTGNIVDGNGEIWQHIKVTRPDGSTYDVSVTAGVPQSGISFTAPGSIVHVLYMPYDEKNVVIGWLI